MISLKGKTALITGGSRGLGKSIALHLAKEGVHVAITGTHETTLKEVVAEIQSYGIRGTYAVFDVADKGAVKEGIEAVVKELGGLNILINNAGIAGFGSVQQMETDEWERIIQVNLLGAYYVAKFAVPHIVASGEGDILNVSSTAGLKGSINTSAYSASKAGLIALSESMLQELRKQNVRVTTLLPSTIATDLTMKGLKITDGNPEKVLQPEDFAELVLDVLKMNRRALINQTGVFSTNP